MTSSASSLRSLVRVCIDLDIKVTFPPAVHCALRIPYASSSSPPGCIFRAWTSLFLSCFCICIILVVIRVSILLGLRS